MREVVDLPSHGEGPPTLTEVIQGIGIEGGVHEDQWGGRYLSVYDSQRIAEAALRWVASRIPAR